MLFLPIGPPACGKSQFGRRHFTDSEIVCPDLIREWLTDDINDQTCNKQVFAVVDRVVAERMRRGLDTYLDATNLRPNFWPEYEDRLFILFETSLDTCRVRNTARDRVVPDHVMTKMELSYLDLLRDLPDPWVQATDFDRGDYR